MKKKNKEKVVAPEKKNSSFRLDKQTLKALKIAAIEHETSVQNILELLVLDFLKGDQSIVKSKS